MSMMERIEPPDRGGAPPGRSGPPGVNPEVVAALLEDVSSDIENLGLTLCSDMEMALRHGESLQVIDRLAQTMSGLAGVMRAGSFDNAVAGVALESLRDKLVAFHTAYGFV